ncbi:DUF4010 domain-containing protein [Bdellovibrio sp. HCB-162]|uniref:DUF4010 domain-containing protein n=1 Tax=Bdellovibrio sp. HCB-162 TaxID=3394234 RepID=UPI0039BD759F
MNKVRSFVILSLLIGLALLWVPRQPIDPLELINPFKILQLILFLALIQILGVVIMRIFNEKIGGIALGVVSGFISSTAFTASLSKQSHQASEDEVRLLSLSYLSSLLGMVVEAIILVFIGTTQMHWEFLAIVLVPTLWTVGLIYWRTYRLRHVVFKKDPVPSLDIASLIKLAVFVGIFLILSKFLQRFFGKSGITFLTFLVCLFELHGSVIGNVQLHELGQLSVRDLGNLLAIGIFASYLAKMMLVEMWGSPPLRRRVRLYSLQLICSLAVGWFTFFWILKD